MHRKKALLVCCLLVVSLACTLTPAARPATSTPAPLVTGTSTFTSQPPSLTSRVVTPTLTPTTTPTPTPGLPPPLTQDMLIYGGDIMRLDHVTGQTQPLIETATDAGGKFSLLSFTRDGKQLALGRYEDQAYTLRVYDATTRKTIDVVPKSRIVSASMSPDGKWLVYIMDAAIYVAPTADPAQGKQVGVCNIPDPGRVYDPCTAVIWAPDSRVFAWNDGTGVWTGGVDQAARQVISHIFSDDWSVRVYAPRDWSPTGRYLRLFEGYYEGGGGAILDTQTGQHGTIESLWRYGGNGAGFAWMDDGRILVVRTNGMPIGEIWRVEPGSENLLVLDREFTIPGGPGDVPLEPSQLPDGRIAFVVVNNKPDGADVRGLYVAGPGGDKPYKLIEVPQTGHETSLVDVYFSVDLDWSPDGLGVIYRDGDNNIQWYFNMDTNTVYDVGPLLSRDCCYHVWLK